ncbi:MAG: hypothetical protein HC807_00945, partial [Gammaproteobacteria bacterium]|nr:hypothetical protein [Gammaproteobacteria bacterium]
TAHLGNALREGGYRPLLIDLDLQGSLSSMFLPLDRLTERAHENLLLQHFLSDATHHRSLNLLNSILPILSSAALFAALLWAADAWLGARVHVVMPCDDRLADGCVRLSAAHASTSRLGGMFDELLVEPA